MKFSIVYFTTCIPRKRKEGTGPLSGPRTGSGGLNAARTTGSGTSAPGCTSGAAPGILPLTCSGKGHWPAKFGETSLQKYPKCLDE